MATSWRLTDEGHFPAEGKHFGISLILFKYILNFSTEINAFLNGLALARFCTLEKMMVLFEIYYFRIVLLELLQKQRTVPALDVPAAPS